MRSWSLAVTASSPSLRVLIVGGYGIFGGRLAELLADEPRLTLIIAGRSLAKAEFFCASRPVRARLFPAEFDRDQPLEPQLRALKPDVIVDASGPFQDYGKQPYRLIEAAIAHGADYFDFSDGAAFVRGVTGLDAAARQRGVAILSGVSSFPVLTAAVVRHLAGAFSRIDAIRAGIAPSPHAIVGENVLRAIAGYAGQAVPARRRGQTLLVHPLTETCRFTIAPPGKLPLPNTLFSLVEVPDLLLLADLWPGLRSVWVGAGPRPEILHHCLIGLSLLVRWKILPSLAPLAGLFLRAGRILRWGSHRGGMVVEVEGAGHRGEKLARGWHLTAEGDDGPYIPAMAIEALIRQRLDGTRPEPGARSAAGALTLADYDRVFAGRPFAHGTRDLAAEASLPLYPRILGSAYQDLPPAIQALHRHEAGHVVSGRASVERGKGLLSRLVGALVGFPEAGTDVPVRVTFEIEDGREVWTREFAGRRFRSVQTAGRGRNAYLVDERFGLLSFALALLVEDGRLKLVVRNWRFLGLRLPRFLAPSGDSFESAEDGRFNFHVEIAHPLLGLIVRYKGWLVSEPRN
ncbi:saccharopine dehydrogenase [Labrys okinawensis]|uniref:Saccharopine dehydrogenase n=1 Tax=Labrys okinawensis TaxID=346911 RepID=A0A2S9Q470_9HYPH|nr:saccharopine dehydrogenase [Labrys okinawensis]